MGANEKSMIYSECGHTEDPKGYNQNISNWRFQALKDGNLLGCVGARACESCGTIQGGTCMCIPIFTCCKCGFENGEKWNKLWKDTVLEFDEQTILSLKNWYLSEAPYFNNY